MNALLAILARNARRWFPVERRVSVSVPNALQVARPRSTAEVAFWCKSQFPDSRHALCQFIRIERRLGRSHSLKSGAQLYWSPPRQPANRAPGYYLYQSLLHWLRK